MAEIKFNKAYDDMGLLDQKFYDSTFKDAYDPNKAQPMLEGKSGYNQMKAAYETQQEVPEKSFLDSINIFGSASADEPEQYGLVNTEVASMYTPEMQLAMFGHPNALGTQQYYEGTTVPVAAPFSNAANTDFMSQFQTPQAANRYSGMGQVGPVKSDMIGNTIAEAMIDEDRIPGRIQESVPNYQNWFERMMSGVQNTLGGTWGKTKELGSRFKEKAGPVFGLASMFANATNPLNPKSFNYNPNLKGQLDFMDKEMGGWSTNNPGTGLMQYGADTPLAGQNVMSVFGSNDPIAQLEKTLARRQKTWENYDNQWSNLKEKDIDAFNIQKKNWENKFFSEKQKGWLDDVKADQKARIDKKNKALAIKEAQKEARKKQQQYSGPQTYNYNPNIQTTGPTYGPHKGGGGNWGNAPGTKGGWGPGAKKDGGRVRFSDGGLATLFTRRG